MSEKLKAPAAPHTHSTQFSVVEAVVRIEYALGHLQSTVEAMAPQLALVTQYDRRINTLETIISYTAAGIGLAVLLYTTLGGV